MTKPLCRAILFVVFTSPFSGSAQIKIQTHAGVSYIEHLSIGAGIGWKNHNIVALYGSNVFIHPKDFGSYFIQYSLNIRKLTFRKSIPVIGVKGGQTIFTDNFYKWNLVSLIPFIGLQRPITDQLDLVFQSGVAFSFEQSVKRINYGEIGHYKDRLPELKVGIVYKLGKN